MLVRDEYADEIMSATHQLRRGHHRLGRASSRGRARRTRRISTRAFASCRARRSIRSRSSACRSSRAARIKGALNIYRDGEDAVFSETEFELAKRFGDAAALALDNARDPRAARASGAHRFADRALQPQRLLRAAPPRAAGVEPHARARRGAHARHRRLQARQRRPRPRRRRRAAPLPRRGAARDRPARGRRSAVSAARSSPSSWSRAPGRTRSRVAERIQRRLAAVGVPRQSAGSTVSVGLALGPEHAMNPRELAACAEAAMMTAKAQGKNRIVLYSDAETRAPRRAERPTRDVRSIAHLKMLQSLSGKLNRLNDVREIGEEIAAELRSLIDYHNCRVFVVRRRRSRPGRLPRRALVHDGRRSPSSCSGSRSAWESPAAAPSSASRSSSATPRTASSARRSRGRRRSRSRCSPCRSGTARGSSA